MPYTVTFPPNTTHKQAFVISDATERSYGVMTPSMVVMLRNAHRDVALIAGEIAELEAEIAELSAGGYQVVANEAARDALPSLQLDEGMLVYEVLEQESWRLLEKTPSRVWQQEQTIIGSRDAFSPMEAPEVVVAYIRPDGVDAPGRGASPDNAYLTPEYAAANHARPIWTSLMLEMTGYGVYAPGRWQLPELIGPDFAAAGWRFAAAQTEKFPSIFFTPLMIYAEPVVDLTIAAGTYTWTVDQVTGRCTLTVAGANWTANQWQGALFAQKSSFEARVISNTSNALTLSYSVFYPSYPPDTSSDCYLMHESCTIDLTPNTYDYGDWLVRSATSYSLSMCGIRWKGGYQLLNGNTFPSLYMDGCRGPFGDSKCTREMQAWGCWFDEEDPLYAGYNYIWVNAPFVGLYNSVIRNTWLIQNQFGRLHGQGLRLDGINGFGDGYYHGTAGNAPLVNVSLQCSDVINSVGAFRGLNASWFGVVGFCRFTSCSYGGILLQREARALVNGPLDGTGNGSAAGGCGISVLDGSKLWIQGGAENTGATLDATNCKIGGTVAELRVGALATTSMSTFFATKNMGDPHISDSRVTQQGGILDESIGVIPVVYDDIGSSITSATTISPTKRTHEVTGSASISTINLPWTGFQGTIRLCKTIGSTWQLVTGGNIALAANPSPGAVIELTRVGSTWYVN